MSTRENTVRPIPPISRRSEHSASASELRARRSRSFNSDLDLHAKATVSYSGPRKSPTAKEEEEKRKRLRGKVLIELLQSEIKYVRELDLLMELYYLPFMGPGLASQPPWLSHNDIDTLFSTIETIHKLNINFLSEIGSVIQTERKKLFSRQTGDTVEDVLLGDPDDILIGGMLLKFTPFFKLYTTYVNNHADASLLVRRIQKEGKTNKYKHANSHLEGVMSHPKYNGQTLESFLIMPIQRIPRYKLLVEQLLKHTCSSSRDYQALSAAISQIKKVTAHINDEVSRQHEAMAVLNIQDIFTGNTTLVAPGRSFVRQGPLVKVGRRSNKLYEFFLFSDLLCYADSSLTPAGRKFTMHREIPINEAFAIQNIRDEEHAEQAKEQHSHRFFIVTHHKSFIVYAKNRDEKIEWVDALNKCVTEQRKSIKDGRSVVSAPILEQYKRGSKCGVCGEVCSMFNRRHCKACGRVVHSDCSTTRMILEGTHRGDNQSSLKRVCDECILRIRKVRSKEIDFERKTFSPTSLPPPPPSSSSSLSSSSQYHSPHSSSSSSKRDSSTPRTSSRMSSRHRSPSPARPRRPSAAQLETMMPQENRMRRGSVTGSYMDLTTHTSSLSLSSPPSLVLCRALFKHVATANGELSFSAGDIIRVVATDIGDHWKGRLNGKTGMFPSNHVTLITASFFFSLYPFTARDSSQELSLSVDDIVYLIDADSAGWWFGVKDTHTSSSSSSSPIESTSGPTTLSGPPPLEAGWFPCSHVREYEGYRPTSGFLSSALSQSPGSVITVEDVLCEYDDTDEEGGGEVIGEEMTEKEKKKREKEKRKKREILAKERKKRELLFSVPPRRPPPMPSKAPPPSLSVPSSSSLSTSLSPSSSSFSSFSQSRPRSSTFHSSGIDVARSGSSGFVRPSFLRTASNEDLRRASTSRAPYIAPPRIKPPLPPRSNPFSPSNLSRPPPPSSSLSSPPPPVPPPLSPEDIKSFSRRLSSGTIPAERVRRKASLSHLQRPDALEQARGQYNDSFMMDGPDL